MTVGRLKQIHLVLLLGISLFILLFMAYSLYINLSGTVLLSFDMGFEDAQDKDLSICRNEFNTFVPVASSNSLSPWAHFSKESSLFLYPLTSYGRITPVPRC